MYQVVVDEAVLGEIVQRLVRAIDPDRIILFGSRARGKPRPDSDVDLLIVKDSEQPLHRRAIAAHRALAGLDCSVDIIWRTPAEVREWAQVRTHVIGRALREGRVLHEKQD